MTKRPIPDVHYHVTNGVRTYVWSRDKAKAQARVFADNRNLRRANKKPTSKVFPCYNPDCYLLHQNERGYE